MNFIKQLLARTCQHRFSWPHTDTNGRDYQVCLVCGRAYEYDCSTMQRGRLLSEPAQSR